MIKIIKEGELDNGGYEMILSLTLFHREPTTYYKVIRNSSQYEVQNEARNERAQILVSAVGKYISHEEANGLSKDLLEQEAIDRLTKFYNAMQERQLDIKFHCKHILKLEPIMKRIARPGAQYVYYNVLQQMAKEQQDYEKATDKL